MASMEIDGEGGKAPPADLSNSEVQTKYRDAAAIANAVLAQVLEFVAPGKLVADVCEFGDAAIVAAVAKVYKSKKAMEKGIAFPTCVSVNETVAHYSPYKASSKTLAVGDAVKIDLGVHLDGCVALVAHTVVLRADAAAPVEGPQADVIQAAYAAAEIALRLIKPGNKASAVTAAIEAVAKAYGVAPMAGVACSQLTQFQVDTGKQIPLRAPEPEAGGGGKPDDATFEAGEAYAVDIAFSTGEGKSLEQSESKTTVYKRALEVAYQLKLKASRALLSEVNKRFPTLPFTLRSISMDEKDARLGVSEAVKHGSLVPYAVIEERDPAAKTAHVRFTALLLPGGTLKVTGLDAPSWAVSTKALPADLQAIRDSVAYVKPPKKAAGGGGDAEMKA